MEEIVATEIDPLKVDVCDPFPVQTGSYSYTMEELEQSSLEEKVDLGNLVLFPPESRDVVPGGSGGAGGAMALTHLGSSVNPISTRGTDYAHLITTGPLGFSDLPTALIY